jgi:hypothetical protein
MVQSAATMRKGISAPSSWLSSMFTLGYVQGFVQVGFPAKYPKCARDFTFEAKLFPTLRPCARPLGVRNQHLNDWLRIIGGKKASR